MGRGDGAGRETGATTGSQEAVDLEDQFLPVRWVGAPGEGGLAALPAREFPHDPLPGPEVALGLEEPCPVEFRHESLDLSS